MDAQGPAAAAALRANLTKENLAAETAYETGAALPAANVAKEIYALAMREGLGEKDFAAVCKVVSSKK